MIINMKINIYFDGESVEKEVYLKRDFNSLFSVYNNCDSVIFNNKTYRKIYTEFNKDKREFNIFFESL